MVVVTDRNSGRSGKRARRARRSGRAASTSPTDTACIQIEGRAPGWMDLGSRPMRSRKLRAYFPVRHCFQR